MKYKKSEVVKPKSVVYPSSFGSHASMMVVDGEYGVINESTSDVVFCVDNRGIYMTERVRLDNHMSDYNRSVSTEEREAKLDTYISGV